jgi:hypothetical protein
MPVNTVFCVIDQTPPGKTIAAMLSKRTALKYFATLIRAALDQNNPDLVGLVVKQRKDPATYQRLVRANVESTLDLDKHAWGVKRHPRDDDYVYRRQPRYRAQKEAQRLRRAGFTEAVMVSPTKQVYSYQEWRSRWPGTR